MARTSYVYAVSISVTREAPASGMLLLLAATLILMFASSPMERASGQTPTHAEIGDSIRYRWTPTAPWQTGTLVNRRADTLIVTSCWGCSNQPLASTAGIEIEGKSSSQVQSHVGRRAAVGAEIGAAIGLVAGFITDAHVSGCAPETNSTMCIQVARFIFPPAGALLGALVGFITRPIGHWQSTWVPVATAVSVPSATFRSRRVLVASSAAG